MVAGVNPYGIGAYLVPLILLVAVPSSALSIFISSSPANNNDDGTVVSSTINDEDVTDQIDKNHNTRNEKVCVAPTFYLDSNKKINYEWNDIIPEMKSLISMPKAKIETNIENKKLKNKKSVCDNERSSVCGYVNDAIGGSEDRTSDSSCLSNDDGEESKDEGYTEDSGDNREKCKKSIETDLTGANYEELPPSSTWPDFPLLVRKSPSSASYNVSQNKEKLEEFIKPIKIHFNQASGTSSESNIDGTLFFTSTFLL